MVVLSAASIETEIKGGKEALAGASTGAGYGIVLVYGAGSQNIAATIGSSIFGGTISGAISTATVENDKDTYSYSFTKNAFLTGAGIGALSGGLAGCAVSSVTDGAGNTFYHNIWNYCTFGV